MLTKFSATESQSFSCFLTARRVTSFLQMKLQILLGLLILLLRCSSPAYSYRILCLFTTPVPSHLQTHMAIAKGLIARGHNLTIVTAIPATVPNNTYRHINLPMEEERATLYNHIGEKTSQLSVFYTMAHSYKSFADWAADCMKHDIFKKFMEEDETYDLVILGYLVNLSQLGVAAHFKSPVVVVWVNQVLGNLKDMVGNPVEVSYVPDFWTSAVQPMSFLERFANYFTNLLYCALDWFVFYYNRSLYRESFPVGQYPDFGDMLNNVSVVFHNSHFTQNVIQANVPALIEIGGIQIKETPDPLPRKIQQFLDDATNGVIYFSLGTRTSTSDLGPRAQRSIYNVLSKLPQKIIWKGESSNLPGHATNILFSKWLPQDDILAHPNVRLFITHGGYGSVTEARYHAMPIAGIPLYGDQYKNLHLAVEAGWGRMLTLDEILLINFIRFYEVVFDMLTTVKYKRAAKKVSELFRDRPMSAMDTCTFWMEYVIRHKGAPHMQSPAVHMGFLSYYSLDVLAFSILLSYIAFIAFKKFLKLVLHFAKVKRKRE